LGSAGAVLAGVLLSPGAALALGAPVSAGFCPHAARPSDRIMAMARRSASFLFIESPPKLIFPSFFLFICVSPYFLVQ
jgi:hypothetical protein